MTMHPVLDRIVSHLTIGLIVVVLLVVPSLLDRL